RARPPDADAVDAVAQPDADHRHVGGRAVGHLDGLAKLVLVGRVGDVVGTDLALVGVEEPGATTRPEDAYVCFGLATLPLPDHGHVAVRAVLHLNRFGGLVVVGRVVDVAGTNLALVGVEEPLPGRGAEDADVIDLQIAPPVSDNRDVAITAEV